MMANSVRGAVSCIAFVSLVALGVLAGPADWLSARGGPGQEPPRVAHRRLHRTSPTPTGPRGPYLGQKPPGRVPEVFGPGFISTATSPEGGIAFSPDGNEIYFGRTGIWATKQVGGV
jgi:hypothetical protein